jgi:hypothetical protein
MTPEDFVQQWERTELKESASYTSHFEAVCRLLEHPLPYEKDPLGEFFTYQYGVKTADGQGYADVFYKGHFAVEYKGKGKYKDLQDAYRQLQRYRENLFNPPLLVVTDIATWEIHTNFPNTEKKIYSFTNTDIANRPEVTRWLRYLFEAPDMLHPARNTEQVTLEAAQSFQFIVDNMRDYQQEQARIARFLTRIVFCLFAEDIGLLPAGLSGTNGIFSEIVERTRFNPDLFKLWVATLFEAMATGSDTTTLSLTKIPYFNGSLFADASVEYLTNDALNALDKAAKLSWEYVEPSIFGTLFERSLDLTKRRQLGAHYTGRDDILLIVEPVLMTPLRRQWADILAQAQPLRTKLDAVKTGQDRTRLTNQLLKLRETMLTRLRSVRVLDPACGSGNFLYVALQALLNMEKEVITHPVWAKLQLVYPEVHPRQMYGMELNPIAHALASIVVWIGYIQWKEHNGYHDMREPVLEDLSENIRCMDAILDLTPNPSLGQANLTPNPSPLHGEGLNNRVVSTPPLRFLERGQGGEDKSERGQGGGDKIQNSALSPQHSALHKDRTLTNLYNALNVFRGKEKASVKPAAGDFAPRLDALHQALDEAVCRAYGWDVSILQDEEAILRGLLALNLARSQKL